MNSRIEVSDRQILAFGVAYIILISIVSWLGVAVGVFTPYVFVFPLLLCMGPTLVGLYLGQRKYKSRNSTDPN